MPANFVLLDSGLRRNDGKESRFLMSTFERRGGNSRCIPEGWRGRAGAQNSLSPLCGLPSAK